MPTSFAKSNHHENAVVNTMRGSNLAAWTPHLALSTANPTEDGSGIAEPVANGYAREAITFAAPADGVTSNSNEMTFTANGGNWGNITHGAIFDALSGGNMRYYGALEVAKTINDGDSLIFAATKVEITEK